MGTSRPAHRAGRGDCAGLLYWTIALGVEHYSDIGVGRLRLWWDVAAGTELVRLPREAAAGTI